eukprot:974227-Rhodomonas_salina.1
MSSSKLRDTRLPHSVTVDHTTIPNQPDKNQASASNVFASRKGRERIEKCTDILLQCSAERGRWTMSKCVVNRRNATNSTRPI